MPRPRGGGQGFEHTPTPCPRARWRIIDARLVNTRFADPPGAHLCSSESSARIEVVLPQATIAFPQSNWGPLVFFWVSLMFGALFIGFVFLQLLPVTSDWVRLQRGNSDWWARGLRERRSTSMPWWASAGLRYPWVSRGLCMFASKRENKECKVILGFVNLSFFRSNANLEFFVSLKETDLGGQGGGAGKRHCICVDNLGAITSESTETDADLNAAAAQIKTVGPSARERKVTHTRTKALGARLDVNGFRASLSSARLWGVRRGILFALGCRRLPGRVWEVPLGHFAFCALLDRCMIGVCRSIYGFINKNYFAPAPLWGTARQEISAAASLLFLMGSSWRSPWAPASSLPTPQRRDSGPR